MRYLTNTRPTVWKGALKNGKQLNERNEKITGGKTYLFIGLVLPFLALVSEEKYKMLLDPLPYL